MENHPFLRSLVAEGGSSGTGRLASTGSPRSQPSERFDAELSGRLREREAAGERVEERRETRSEARERRGARAERSERRTLAPESSERTASPQATDESNEAQAQLEGEPAPTDTPTDGCSERCATADEPANTDTAERAGEAATKPTKAARAELELAVAPVEVDQAPATETLAAQLGQAKGLESQEKLGTKPNVALEGADGAVDAQGVELALDADVPAAPEAATDVAQPGLGEANEPQAPDFAAAIEKIESAPRSEATAPHAATRENTTREVTARPELEAAKNAPRSEPPVSAERAADMLRQIRLQLSPELRQATIQLEPRELGRISIKVTLRGGSAHAELRAEKREALEALQKQIPELEAALERAGLGGGELSLQLGLEERSTRDDAPAFTPARRSLVVSAPAPLARALSARLPASSGIDTYA